MAKIIIHLKEREHSALCELAQREYRTLPSQAAIIIHHQLQDLGLLPGDVAKTDRSTDQTLKNLSEA